MTTVNITDENFEAKVLKSEKPVMVFITGYLYCLILNPENYLLLREKMKLHYFSKRKI